MEGVVEQLTFSENTEFTLEEEAVTELASPLIFRLFLVRLVDDETLISLEFAFLNLVPTANSSSEVFKTDPLISLLLPSRILAI